MNEITGSDNDPILLPSMVNIDVSGNHIYFYDEIDENSCLKLNKVIREMTSLLIMQGQNGLQEPCVYLHINSPGGSVTDAFSVVDTILTNPVKVITIVEGCAASAATFISLSGHRRYITEHAYMLIHQLSSGFWGKHNELEDEMQNLNNMMKMIRDFYKKYSNIPPKELDEMLKHDLYYTPSECVQMGLVEEIKRSVHAPHKRPATPKKPKPDKKAVEAPAAEAASVPVKVDADKPIEPARVPRNTKRGRAKPNKSKK